MKRLLASLSLLAIVFTMSAFAENTAVMNVHVEKAVAIPGKVLLPGNYIFRLQDSGSGQNIVAITSADSDKTYGFVQVFTARRNSYNGASIQETAADATGLTRIDSWYFPGQQSGYRFIYSKGDLRKLETAAQKMKSNGTAAGL